MLESKLVNQVLHQIADLRIKAGNFAQVEEKRFPTWAHVELSVSEDATLTPSDLVSKADGSAQVKFTLRAKRLDYMGNNELVTVDAPNPSTTRTLKPDNVGRVAAALVNWIHKHQDFLTEVTEATERKKEYTRYYFERAATMQKALGETADTNPHRLTADDLKNPATVYRATAQDIKSHTGDYWHAQTVRRADQSQAFIREGRLTKTTILLEGLTPEQAQAVLAAYHATA